MILDRSVTLQVRTSADITFDTEGMAVEVWTANNTTIKVNRQPISGELESAMFGLNKAPFKDVYFSKVNTTITEGTSRIIDGTSTFDILKVKKYGNHYEIIVSEVVE